MTQSPHREPAKGRARPSDQALAVPAKPASGLDASRFDPSRIRGVVHFISAKPDKSGNVTACGLEFAYPMRGNGWRVSGLTCPDCDRAVCDAAHAAIATEARRAETR